MDWSTWAPDYAAIMAQFGWSEADDRASAQTLRDAVPHRGGFRHVGTELKHRSVATVVGCGPSIMDANVADLHGIIVAADGATEWLREQQMVPRIVVTDLDGDTEALHWAAENGSSIVVHAHGANQDRMGVVSELGSLVCGTYQCAPNDDLQPLRNLGGFTDGDRAVALCEDYGVREVRLLGFDFEAAPSRYSGTWNPATKMQKLAWAKKLINDVNARGKTAVIHP